MIVPNGESKTILTVKNSKFIAQCFPISSKNIKPKIAELWNEHPGAKHIVYAFILGDKNSCLKGMSDDGEPKGTAGRPILQILEGSGITNILCTVTRYFGGTLLGTGGLVKAYSQSAKNAIEKLQTKKFVKEVIFNLSLAYSEYEKIKYILSQNSCNIIEEKYGDRIQLKCSTEENNFTEIEDKISGIKKIEE